MVYYNIEKEGYDKRENMDIVNNRYKIYLPLSACNLSSFPKGLHLLEFLC
jgi:hypothetical protein